MRKESLMKKGIAMALVGAMAISLFALSGKDTYAANAIDLEADCTLTIEVAASMDQADTSVALEDATKLDLATLKIPVKLFKVAGVDVSGNFTAVAPFASMDFSDINSETNAQTWLDKATEANERLTGDTPSDYQCVIADGRGQIDNVKPGLYLVRPIEESELSQEDKAVVGEYPYNADHSYKYSFTPYLTALPGNNYYTTGNDDWDYSPTIGLKAGREMQYAELIIQKELENYNALTGAGYFVFQVEGEKDGVKYSNVAAINFDGGVTTKTAILTHIPVGMEVTVTEVYSGGSYTNTVAPGEPVKIIAEELKQNPEENNIAKFTNKYDDKLIYGTGVLNVFEPTDTDWNWQIDTGYDPYPQN